MCEQYKKEGFVPTLILASPTKRTIETAEVIADFFDKQVTEEPNLGFYGDEDKLISSLESITNGTVYFVGHGPLLQRLAERLSSKNLPRLEMTTSSALIFTFKDHISFGHGNYVKYLAP